MFAGMPSESSGPLMVMTCSGYIPGLVEPMRRKTWLPASTPIAPIVIMLAAAIWAIVGT